MNHPQDTEPAWKARKAQYDALDDGAGPYMTGGWGKPHKPFWDEFLAWAVDHMGQGFSLACFDGHVIDPITAATYHGYVVGREHGSKS